MPTSDSPCHNHGAGCPERTVEPNCHATCERYIIWAELEYDRRKKYRQAEVITDEFLYKQPARMRYLSRERSRQRNGR